MDLHDLEVDKASKPWITEHDILSYYLHTIPGTTRVAMRLILSLWMVVTSVVAKFLTVHLQEI